MLMFARFVFHGYGAYSEAHSQDQQHREAWDNVHKLPLLHVSVHSVTVGTEVTACQCSQQQRYGMTSVVERSHVLTRAMTLLTSYSKTMPCRPAPLLLSASQHLYEQPSQGSVSCGQCLCTPNARESVVFTAL
jgi:hypothetical protein